MAGRKARTTALVIALGLLTALGIWLSTRGAGRADPVPVTAPRASETVAAEPASTAVSAPVQAPASASEGQRRADVEAALPRTTHARAFSAVTGTVVEDATSQPIAGARVTLSLRLHEEFSNLDLRVSRTERQVGETQTDGEGRFSVRVPSDNPLALRVESAGYATAREDHVFGGEDLELRLIAGTVLAGRVTRASTGEPVAGVGLRAWVLETRQELFRIETDAGGNYRVDDLVPCVARFAVTPDTLAAPGWHTLELQAGQLLRHDVALEDGHAIRGSVTDAVTGLPIADAEIGEGWTFRKSTRTDAEGRYALLGFGGEGVYDVHVRARGYGGDQFEFDYEAMPTEDSELDFQLSPGMTAIGVVVDPDGAPLAGAYVAAVASVFLNGDQVTDWESGTTDASGWFEVTSLNARIDHQLLLRMEGYGTRVYEFPTDETAAEPLDLGTFVLGPAATVRGSVSTTGGAPLPNFEVTLRGYNDDIGRLQTEGDVVQDRVWYTRSRESRTDRAGGFHFTDIAPGTYTVGARVPGRRDDTTVEVRVPEGGLVEDVRIELEFGGTISGRVVTPEGRGVAGITINARLIDTGRGQITTTNSGPGGVFELVGVTEDEVELVCFPWEYNWGDPAVRLASCLDTRVAVGATDVLLRMRREVHLEGRVVDAAGEPETGLYVIAYAAGERHQVSSARTDGEGRFELELPEDEVVDLETGTHRYVSETESYESTGRVDPIRLEALASDATDVLIRLD